MPANVALIRLKYKQKECRDGGIVLLLHRIITIQILVQMEIYTRLKGLQVQSNTYQPTLEAVLKRDQFKT